jgi:hypothetical protein
LVRGVVWLLQLLPLCNQADLARVAQAFVDLERKYLFPVPPKDEVRHGRGGLGLTCLGICVVSRRGDDHDGDDDEGSADDDDADARCRAAPWQVCGLYSSASAGRGGGQGRGGGAVVVPAMYPYGQLEPDNIQTYVVYTNQASHTRRSLAETGRF